MESNVNLVNLGNTETKYIWENGLSFVRPVAAEIIERRIPNVSIFGFPILHVIIKGRKDCYNEDRASYLELFKQVLSIDGVDANINDHDGLNVLTAATLCLDHEILHLLAKRVNPNSLNIDGSTALLYALSHCSDTKTLIILKEMTEVTQEIQMKIDKLFFEALESLDFDKINNLFELEIIKQDSLPLPNNQNLYCHQGIDGLFTNGFWIRVLENDKFDTENATLNTRQNLSDQELAAMGHNQSKTGDHYTPYSPSSFIKKGISSPLYREGLLGIIHQLRGRTIAHWYNGEEEKLTREGGDMDFSKEILDNGALEGQFTKITENNISIKFSEQYKASFSQVNDKYKILSRPEYRTASFYRWNEGQVRYKRGDILAIFVPDETGSTLLRANELIARLNLPNNFPICRYEKGRMWSIR